MRKAGFKTPSVKSASLFQRQSRHQAYLQRTKFDITHETYMQGYASAIYCLINKAKRSRDNLYKDTVIFPLLFLVYHYFELQIKEILLVDNLIRKNTWEFKEHHNLRDLWYECREVFNGRPSFSKAYLDSIQKIVFEISNIASKGEAFRYIRSTRGNDYKNYLTSFPDWIDYKNIEEIFMNLEGVFFGMHASLLQEYEHLQEIGQ